MTEPCRICHGPTLPSYQLRSNRHSVDVWLRRCRACNAFFSDGGPRQPCGVAASACSASLKRRCRLPGSSTSAPGMGYAVEVAGNRGWRSTGIGPNAVLARSARNRGLAIEHGYLSVDTRGQYDSILIDNVLEHVADLRGFTTNAARLLSADGLLVIAIPPLIGFANCLPQSRTFALR